MIPFDPTLARRVGAAAEPDAEAPRRAEAPADGRNFARRADVVVAALTLACGLTAALLGLRGPVDDPSAAALPPLTWPNLRDGHVTEAFEEHVADRFPLREPLLGLEAALRRARGLAPGEEGVVVYRVSPQAMDLGPDPDLDLDVDEPHAVALPAAEPLAVAPERNGASDGDDARPSRAPASGGPAAPDPVSPGRALRRASSGILIRDRRAMQGFGGAPSGAPAYARTLNAIHEAVRDRATVYAIIVPTAQEFYLPEEARSRLRRERPNIMGTYARFAPGIRTVDAHTELAAHTDENVYFRTDHHWTGLGAYYAYRAFCETAGLDAVPLDRMSRRVVNERWLGSLYRLTRDPALRERPDRVEIWVPTAQAEVSIPRGRRGAARVVPLFHEHPHGYGVFLGGDHPIMRMRTSTQNGRRAILVKNSYGNAFAVYLVSHYAELVLLDYRSFRGRLVDLVDESEMPTDIIFINGAPTANSRAHTALIRALLDGRR